MTRIKQIYTDFFRDIIVYMFIRDYQPNPRHLRSIFLTVEQLRRLY